MKAFRQASNPVEVFIADLMDNPPRGAYAEAIYGYRYWCEEQRHKPLYFVYRVHPDSDRVPEAL